MQAHATPASGQICCAGNEQQAGLDRPDDTGDAGAAAAAKVKVRAISY